MLRSILAVIVGYIAMFIVVAISFTIVQFSLGTEQVFKAGSYEVSTVFIVFAIVLSFVAAVLGGLVCASIARSARAPIALAVLVLLLGFVSAALQLSTPAPGPRAGDVTPFEAAQNARQPAWYALLIPFIGAGGVMAGARLRGRPTSASPPGRI